jgi:membrane protein implicated in regulation of membrane protease activity
MLFTYICLAVGGCLILLVSLMLGAGHDVNLESDVGVDVDHDADGGGDHHWFSVKVLSAFATAFGAGGAIALSFHTSQVISLLVALICGVSIAVVADAMINLFYRQQSTSTYSISQLAGKTGTVTFPILPDGIGEVRVSLGSSVVTYAAKTQDSTGVKQGDTVLIISPGPPMIVKKVS